MAGVHLREVLRNPWTLFAGVALVGISLAFSGRGSAVGLVSLVAVLQLYLPPLTVVVAAPLLTRRETWAFWAALPRPAGAAYRGATVGIALGLLLPLLAGTGASAAILGLGALELLLLVATVAALVVLWTCTISFLSAATLDPTRAMALGLAAWALLALAYGPTVVGLAVAFADYPLGCFMLLAIALNPAELLRVGLLQALGVPVLVGPIGKLVVDTVPNGGFGLGIAATLLVSALLLWLSGHWFARRDR